MAGCTKADKKRKSVANVAYKAGNRQDVNAKRTALKTVHHNRSMATKALTKLGKAVCKGAARILRRKACLSQFGVVNKDTWNQYKTLHPVVA